MNDPFKQHGAFSWCELMTPDVASAKRFYGELFGWEMLDMPMEDMTYTVLKAAGGPVGGILPTPKAAAGMPPHWGIYVTVEDVDATALRAVALGGKICMGPQDIPNVGRFCVIQDPSGAVLHAITYLVRDKAG
jgi:predicted enzyme related to lactoylglutathione lyase